MKIAFAGYPIFPLVNNTRHILTLMSSRGVDQVCVDDAETLAKPTPTNRIVFFDISTSGN